MPGTATTRYVIRTTSGNKGPFSPAEIGRFVDEGKLPASAKILDVDANRAVTAAEAIVAAASETTAALPPRAAQATPRGRAAPTETVAPRPAARPTPAPAAPEAGADEHIAPEAEAVAEAEALEATDAPLTGTIPKSAGGAALEQVDGNAATPKAPGVRAASRTGSGERRTRTRTRTGSTTASRRGGRGVAKKPKPLWLRITIIAGIAVAVLAVGTTVALVTMKQDRFKEQGPNLLAQTLAKPDAIAVTTGDPGFIKFLIRKDHPAALEAARLPRGTFQGYKPAFDEGKYREALRTAIAKQVAEPDSALLIEAASALVSADDALVSDIATGKKLAEKAVALDQEKNWVSLDALAWALFKSNDLKRAVLIEEQAVELAPDTESKAKAGSALAKFKNAH